MTVSFNDRTQDPEAPLIEYPGGYDHRVVHEGASLMGWSYSLDGGKTFVYGGRQSPPAGWAVLWGDPAITRDGQYLANLGGSMQKWTGDLVDQPMNRLDGFCVARSSDDGKSYGTPACFKNGTCANSPTAQCINDDQCGEGGCNGDFYDGEALAIFDEFVWYASQNVRTHTVDVWRAPLGTLNFQPWSSFVHPFAGHQTALHPRFATGVAEGPDGFSFRLYIAAHSSNGAVLATWVEKGGTQWAPPLFVSGPAVLSFGPDGYVLGDRSLRMADQFSFDVGDGELRTIYTRRNQQTGKLWVEVAVCGANLFPNPNFPNQATCYISNAWTTKTYPGDQFSPLINRGIGANPMSPTAVETAWKVAWLGTEYSPNSGTIAVRQSSLLRPIVPVFEFPFLSTDLAPPVVPCNYTDANGGYWGDYNDLVALSVGSPYQSTPVKFASPYTRNGTSGPNGECGWRSTWTADIHVGAAIFD